MPSILIPVLFACTLALGLLAPPHAMADPPSADAPAEAPATPATPATDGPPAAEGPPATATAAPARAADPNRPAREPGFARQTPPDSVGKPGEVRGRRVDGHQAGDKNQPGSRPNTGITIRR
ncbi:MAG: hypothetical protein JRG76_09515 [Deltaproteobacteria bacterium]|nr:hypothetical protein [Deltaproteobacteria bacterium]MBW2414731.1 hypothetical protein [Deltaproteobacteria bacterium]